AGKSSIARELQHCLNDYYLHLGIDTFIAMMPEKSNRLKVIVDDAINGAEEMAVWQSVLAGKQCLFVGIFCADELLNQREKQRGDRLEGSAIEQASRVHEGIRYDIEINTDTHSPLACAQQILRAMNRGAKTRDDIPDHCLIIFAFRA
ncbi:MAG: hypothetical protein WCF45_07595, partial [Photobacterium halotolerans]